MSNAVVIQALISGGFALLGAFIAGITLLRVTQANQKHALALEQRRAKLAKGEDLVAVLSELSSWRARDEQDLLTEIAQLESRLNRAYALAITYYGDEERVTSNFYSGGHDVIEKLNEIAELRAFGGIHSSPGVNSESVNIKYALLQVTARNLTQYVLDEMRRTH
jgi:hypothetical protein